MKSNVLIFLMAFVLAFGGGYFFFGKDKTESKQVTQSTEGTTETKEGEEEEQASIPAEYEIMSTNSCISCHAVDSLGIEGANTGPDLSNAYSDIEGKHGVDLDTFLQEPTSAVMSSVIGDNPLTDEARSEIIELLKKASEK